MIVIPDFLVHPELIERITGYSLKTLLDNTAIPVLVYQSGDIAWCRPTPAVPSPSTYKDGAPSRGAWRHSKE